MRYLAASKPAAVTDGVRALCAAHSPQRPAGSTVSINAQASTGDNLASSRPTDAEIIAQENLIRCVCEKMVGGENLIMVGGAVVGGKNLKMVGGKTSYGVCEKKPHTVCVFPPRPLTCTPARLRNSSALQMTGVGAKPHKLKLNNPVMWHTGVLRNLFFVF